MHRRSSLLAVVLLASACHIRPLIDPSRLPAAEKGVVTDGRYFVVAGHDLWEVVDKGGKKEGSHDLDLLLHRDDCVLAGLTAHGRLLYATCTRFDLSGPLPIPVQSRLVRVDLRRPAADPARIAEAPLTTPGLFPNGMATGPQGELYVANTYSLIGPSFGLPAAAAVLRLRVSTPGFRVTEEEAIPAAEGGFAPNGLQVRGDRLYLTSLHHLLSARIGSADLTEISVVYETDPTRVLDDFAVLSPNVLALSELTNPNPQLLAFLFPGLPMPSEPMAQLTFVRLESPQGARVLYAMPTTGFTPSSVTPVADRTASALYVTDYLQGGLYRVSVD